MKLPQYITTEEVQRVCRELGIRDWTGLKEAAVTVEDSQIIRNAVGAEATQITADEFRRGLEVELEHGLQFPCEDELADARNYLSGIFSLGLATQDGLAGQLASVTLEGLPEDYLEMYRQRIRALTADDVLATARAYFDSANMQIVVVGDREQIGHQAALFGPVEVYDQQGNRI